MQRTLEASQYLAVLLARYSRIEVHYHRVHQNNAEELGNAIVKVYIGVLRYSAKVKEAATSKRLGSHMIPRHNATTDKTNDVNYRPSDPELQVAHG